ncbi:GNAT family acetyltransferase [Chlorella sorokiniana]|uniref:GNAT family acetyltransferase n=1 Tax=Chlorella sorokiniana TaxID=3076 RepID=A0A2P6TD61_CHLSO|nr:GNAT family acetyltransferase [Chlorella sorokiniana]|eukprot:PRW20572.1 GNAT family acetyltransferase [Chlorella sorokiniana]
MVVCYEGSAASRKRFASLCSRSTNRANRVDGGYIAALDGKLTDNPGSTFRLAVLRNGEAVALAQCTLYNHISGFKQRRIVFLDLVCSDEKVKGAGSILLGELEGYARSLGARVIALQALPSVRATYSRRGFVRGMGNRSDAAVALAGARFRDLTAADPRLDIGRLHDLVNDKDLYAMINQVASVSSGRLSPEFLEALAGEFYPLYNSLYSGGDSVVMYKQLQGADSKGAVEWEGEYGRFADPTKRMLAKYEMEPRSRLFRKVVPGQPPPSRGWSLPLPRT